MNNTETKQPSYFKFIYPYFKDYKNSIAISFLFIMVQVANAIFIPISFLFIISGILKNDIIQVNIFICVAIISAFLNFLATTYGKLQMDRLGFRIAHKIRIAILDKLYFSDISYRKHSGYFYTLLTTQINIAQTALDTSIPTVTRGLLQVLFGSLMLIILNWRVAIILLLSYPIIIVITRKLIIKNFHSSSKKTKAESKVNTALKQLIDMLYVFKCFNAKSYIEDNVKRSTWVLRENSQKASRDIGVSYAFIILAFDGIMVATAGVGAHLIFKNLLTIPVMLTFFPAFLYINRAVKSLSDHWTGLFQGVSAFNEIGKFSSTATKTEKQKSLPAPEHLKQIELTKINFCYEEEAQTLHDINITIPQNATIGLVGHSGSGKSTLLNLLLKIYDITDGELNVNGTPLNDIDAVSWREKVSIITQDTLLINASFRDNISFGLTDIREEDVIKAAKQADIHDFIMSCSNGYDTIISEFGRNLSGGQRQRITIARALVRKPYLLLIDEPTAALDSASETRINQTLENYTKNISAVIATHRLSSICHADYIYVMQQGRVIEAGQHDQLISKHGEYAKMWNLQQLAQANIKANQPLLNPQYLSNLDFFRDLPADIIHELADHFTLHSYNAGDVVIHLNEIGDNFYVISRGVVDIYRNIDDELTYVKTLEDGDCFGEVALIYHTPRNAKVVARTNISLLTLNANRFNHVLNRFPKLKDKLTEIANQRR